MSANLSADVNFLADMPVRTLLALEDKRRSAQRVLEKAAYTIREAASSGNYSTAASSGYGSTAASSGQNTVAMVAGCAGRAKAGENGCIALCWHDGKRNRIVVGYVGEDGIKADTWYRVDGGKLVEAT